MRPSDAVSDEAVERAAVAMHNAMRDADRDTDAPPMLAWDASLAGYRAAKRVQARAALSTLPAPAPCERCKALEAEPTDEMLWAGVRAATVERHEKNGSVTLVSPSVSHIRTAYIAMRAAEALAATRGGGQKPQPEGMKE